MTRHLHVLGLLVSIFITISSTAQDEADYLNKVYKIYGANGILVNGTQYFNVHPKAKGHPNFGLNDWYLSKVYIGGEGFENQFLQYNLTIDELILNHTDEKGVSRALLMPHNRIDSFILGNHKFINTQRLYPPFSEKRYIEEIYHGYFGIYATHLKYFKRKYSEYTPDGFYSKTQTSLYIKNKEGLHRIRNKRQLLRFFSEEKKNIRRHMRHMDFRFKKASHEEWISVMKFIDEIEK